MALGERERVEAAGAVLREAGFAVSQSCHSRASCFDFAARRNRDLLFVKVLLDLGSFSPSDSYDLRTVSESFSAASLVVAEETHERTLEEDTVYTRNGVRAVSPRTFENSLLRNTPPLVQASPGGYYVEIDGEALKRRMQELGLSAGDVAELAGTSRRTIYGYERGMAKASVTAAYNLICNLGVPVARPIDLLEKTTAQHRMCYVFITAKRVFARNRFVRRICKKFSRHHITTVKSAPFDFVIDVPEDRSRIVGAVTDDREPELEARVDEILSVSEITLAYPVLITNRHHVPDRNITCMSNAEIAKISDAKELVRSIRRALSDGRRSRP